MISSFIKFYKNFLQIILKHLALFLLLLPLPKLAVCLYFRSFLFTLETTLSKFSFALSDRFPYSDFTFFQILYRIHLMLDLFKSFVLAFSFFLVFTFFWSVKHS